MGRRFGPRGVSMPWEYFDLLDQWRAKLANGVELRTVPYRHAGDDKDSYRAQVWRNGVLLWEGRCFWSHASAKARATCHSGWAAQDPRFDRPFVHPDQALVDAQADRTRLLDLLGDLYESCIGATGTPVGAWDRVAAELMAAGRDVG